MNRSTTILLAVLAASCLTLVVKYPELEDMHRDKALHSPQPAPPIPKEEKNFFEEIAQAENIVDPIERCKAIPIPKDVNWTQATIDAFCLDVNLPTIGWNEIEGMISQGSGKLLDARFDRMLNSYFSGDVGEGTMRSAYYRSFDDSSVQRQRLVKQWLSSSPNSAHAHAASGMIHLASAFEHRGHRFAADTPRVQFKRMKEEVKLAIKDLEKSLVLNPKIMPAYEALIDCARLVGNTKLATQYFQKAQAIDPKNYHTLFGYSVLMEPRWGGSTEQLEEIAETARKLVPINPRMVNLIASTKTYAAFGIEHKISDREELSILREAAAEGPLNVTLNRYASVCSRIGDHRKAYEIYTQALRLYPNDPNKLSNRAAEAIWLGAYDYAKRDIEAAKRIDPMNVSALQHDAHLDLFANQYFEAEKKLKILVSINYSDEWSLEQLAWIAVFRTQNIAEARAMIDRGLAVNPQNGSFHWLNWELIRRSGQGDLPAATADFIAHVDKTDPRQVDALRYTNDNNTIH